MASEHPNVLVHSAPPLIDGAEARVHVATSETDASEREELWARQLSDDEFEIACIPFFTYGLALGDRVRARHTGSVWELEEILAWSGHFTYRVWFKDEAGSEDKRAVERALAGHGAALEWSSANLLAVDAPSEAIAGAVVGELEPREAAGTLAWEAGQ